MRQLKFLATGFTHKIERGFPEQIFTLLLAMCLLIVHTSAGAADTVESPKACKQCGMDRAVFAKSRMVIVYDDGTTAGVCSLRCAVVEINQHKDRHISSIKVADYNTEKLIDARTAVWVVGGIKKGVMSPVAKWAFAGEEDARIFVKEYGGDVVTFDQAMKAAEKETADASAPEQGQHSHMGHDTGPGSHMLFNPAFGDDVYHTHPAGMWMVNYKFMHMDMRGLRDGTSNVSLKSVGYMRDKRYEYMMIPTSMTMDMHMGMVMYGITDRLTVMAMGNYQSSSMNMKMDMGTEMGVSTSDPMDTHNIGDTELRGMYKISKYFVGSLGISLPTGSITETVKSMGSRVRAPYDMQSGSGTFDLKPALTYNGLSDDGKWNWGAQAQYTWHTGNNYNGWSYGDNFKLSAWLQRVFGELTSWVRMAYNDTGRIRGEDHAIRELQEWSSVPDGDPRNYGGQRLDGAIGASIQRGAFNFGVEGGIPLYQDLNGLQLKTNWFLSIGVQYMF